MFDVMYYLGLMVPGPIVGGTVDLERPIDGGFEILEEAEIRTQYEALRWDDPRDQPTWDELVAYAAAHPIKAPILERLAVIVDALSDEVQAQFGGTIAPAYVALTNGKVNVAKIMIQNLTVPSELEPVKMALLNEFEG